MSLTASQLRFYQSFSESSNREVGIELFFDGMGSHDGYRMLLGNDRTVPTWGTSSVFGHTHPKASQEQVNVNVAPPSSVDYNRAVWDYFAGVQWQLVFEGSGTWAYRPNAALVAFIEAVDPEVRDRLTKRQSKMTYRGGSVTYMMKTFDEVTDMVLNNVAIDNYQLHRGELAISEYIDNVGKCIDNKKRGFDLVYRPANSNEQLTLDGVCEPESVVRTGVCKGFALPGEPHYDGIHERVNDTLTYSWVAAR